MDQDIGALLKKNRKAHGITLQELAEHSGLSVSYLSMLERGLSSPTIANLNKICEALGVTLAGLLLSLDQDKTLVREGERRHIYEDESGVLYEAITEGDRHMRGVCMHVRDMSEHLSEKHVSDEVGHVVKGSLAMTVNGTEYLLDPGDTLYIPANSPHSFHKVGEEESVSVWFYHNVGAVGEEHYPVTQKKLRRSSSQR